VASPGWKPVIPSRGIGERCLFGTDALVQVYHWYATREEKEFFFSAAVAAFNQYHIAPELSVKIELWGGVLWQAL
jgi:hypothetical protein